MYKVFWKTGSSFVVFFMAILIIGGIINNVITMKSLGIMSVIVAVFLFAYHCADEMEE